MSQPSALRRRLLKGSAGLIAAAACGHAAAAAELRVGINAGVSFSETEEQLRRRYAEMLDALSLAVGRRLAFDVVYSDRVTQAVDGAAHDLLLIHTHAALKAERQAGYQVLGFSDDRRDNTVHFFVRPDSPIQSLADAARSDIGVPSPQSWATATARAALRLQSPGRDPLLRPTRHQEVVPLMVELRTVATGVSRSKALVDLGVAQQRLRVVHSTVPMPLYALVAAPRLAPGLAERLRLALTQPADPRTFDHTPFKGLAFAPDEAARLRRFFLA